MTSQEIIVIPVEQIKELFEEMHKRIIKITREMFKKHEVSLMNLKSGNTTLTNQCLDALSRCISDLKESLQLRKIMS